MPWYVWMLVGAIVVAAVWWDGRNDRRRLEETRRMKLHMREEYFKDEEDTRP